MSIACIREEIILFGGPFFACVVQGRNVAGWSGVKQIHFGTTGLLKSLQNACKTDPSGDNL